MWPLRSNEKHLRKHLHKQSQDLIKIIEFEGY